MPLRCECRVMSVSVPPAQKPGRESGVWFYAGAAPFLRYHWPLWWWERARTAFRGSGFYSHAASVTWGVGRKLSEVLPTWESEIL